MANQYFKSIFVLFKPFRLYLLPILIILLFFQNCKKDKFNDLDDISTPEPEDTNVFTFGNPTNINVEFGNLSFGADSPKYIGRTTGLNMNISCVKFDGFRYTVYGLKSNGTKPPEVWQAKTKDGIAFHDAKKLYQVPSSDPKVRWNGGDIALVNDKLFLLHCQLRNRDTPSKGHPFFVFAGEKDGVGWKRLNSEPLYYGQDALSMVWNKNLGKLVNYQTSFQYYEKKYPDNMPKVRRVLNIRTSIDGINWIPGESFAVGGPYLPNDQLIVPDEKDSPDTEFYHFSATDLGEFWAGIMINYIAQPDYIPINVKGHHGPFLSYEWWISPDGINWERPFRENSALDGIPRTFSYYLGQPIVIGNELRWADGEDVYALDRKRMFYLYSKANAEIVTPELTLSGKPLKVELTFDAIRRNENKWLKQGYLMAELLDENGDIIPGFEKEKCVYMPDHSTRLNLKWGELNLPDKALHPSVRLRFCFRDVRLYSVSY